VAIANNGPWKGATPQTMTALHELRNPVDVWQLHRTINYGAENFGGFHRQPRLRSGRWRVVDQVERKRERRIQHHKRANRLDETLSGAVGLKPCTTTGITRGELNAKHVDVNGGCRNVLERDAARAGAGRPRRGVEQARRRARAPTAASTSVCRRRA
jgi:hypothetical protein